MRQNGNSRDHHIYQKAFKKKKTRSCVFSQAAKKGKQKQAVSSLRKVFEGEK